MAAAILVATADAPRAADIDLSPVPPFLLQGLAPNLVLTVDNSASMGRAYMPDEAGGVADVAPFASPDVNQLYFSPWKTYVAGQGAEGASMAPADFAAANQFPYLGLDCYQPDPLDLAEDYRVVFDDQEINKGCRGGIDFFADDARGEAAHYFLWNPRRYYSTNPEKKTDVECNDSPFPPPRSSPVWSACRLCGGDFPDGPDARSPAGCFTKIIVGSADDLDVTNCRDLPATDGAPNPAGLRFVDRMPGESCKPRDNAAFGPGDADAARQNFANWFVYYRSRLLMTKTVLSRVIHRLNPSVRFTFQDMRSNDELWSGTSAFDWLDRDADGRRFDALSQNRRRFLAWLFALDSSAGYASNLQGSHIRAGEFLSSPLARADDIGAYRADPVDVGNNHCGAACRHNFHLLFTDGVWEDVWGHNPGSAEAFPATFWPCKAGEGGCWMSSNPNQDGTAARLPDNRFGVDAYNPDTEATQLFSDANAAMLADVVFYYWRRDLDGDPTNNQVPAFIASWDDATSADSAANFWNPRNDPATWQHLTFFGVGLGIDGVVEPSADRPFGTYESDRGDAKTLAADGFPDGDPGGDYGAGGGPFSGIGAAEGVWNGDSIPAAAKLDDLYHAALNGRGGYFSTQDPSTLISSFVEILNQVSSAVGQEASNSGVAVSAASPTNRTLLLQAVADPSRWRGELRAYQVSTGRGRGACAGKARGEICQSGDATYWTAPQIQSASERTIITLANGTPKAFTSATFSALSREQQLGLLGCGIDIDGIWRGDLACCNTDVDPDVHCPDQVARARARIDYLRGDASRETGSDDGFRRRQGHWLGDILGSGPLVVGQPRSLFVDRTYSEFRNNERHRRRSEVVYVGANDGMLHAFAAADGTELFAYVPAGIYAHLSELTDPRYGKTLPKRAFVDGRIAAADAKFTDPRGNAGWKTVLLGSFGLGAQGVYALNITNPDAVSQRRPGELTLWEFTDASGSDVDDGALDGRDMGYSWAAPAIVRIDADTEDDTEPIWVALVSNGYNNTAGAAVGEDPHDCTDDDAGTNCTVSQTGNAVLYVLQLGGGEDGRILARIDTGQGFCQDPRVAGETPPTGSDCGSRLQGRTNALGPVQAVDTDGDLISDLAYAGDLFGHLWRFDLVDLGQAPALIFSARDREGSPQPITTRVATVRHPTGIGVLVLFGTGQYLGGADKSDLQVQSVYGIWDDQGLVFGAGDGRVEVPSRARGDLLAQQFEAEVSVANGLGGTVTLGRTSTDRTIDWSAGGHRGWYIDLMLADEDPAGERVVVSPKVSGNRVVFVSMLSADCCSAGGESWINALNANDGSRLGSSPFDYNLDLGFDSDDLLDPDDDEPIVGSSIRLVTGGASGIYSAPTRLDLGNGSVQSIVSTSGGGLIRLPDHESYRWRTWLQLR